MTRNVRKFLDVSTAHISPSTRIDMDLEAVRSTQTMWVASTPYGWFVWVPEHDDQGVPPDLSLIFAHARAHGCAYVLFDRDCEKIPGLPVYGDENAQ